MRAVLRPLFLVVALLFGGLSASAGDGAESRRGAPALTLHFFWAANCPHCGEEKPLLEELAGRHPGLELRNNFV